MKKVAYVIFQDSATGEDLKKVFVNVSIEDNELKKGLMFHANLTLDQGMIFIMSKYERQYFWMKNTSISLDIIFLDDKYKVIRIYKNAEPMSITTISSNKKAKYVIEVLAGFSDKYNIKEGDKISFFS